MRASDGKRPCHEARVHYYDLLCPDEAAVPLPVRQHVAACSFCREQMNRLRETLLEWERRPDGRGTPGDEVIETLAEQFQLLDERVTCSDARPCLPQLAMAVPQIKIPTPITVHVDHCRQCAADLAALRKLQLTTDQLRRLSQLFSSGASEGSLPAPVYAGNTPGAESRPVEGSVLTCHDVSAADIFDSVVPPGVPPDARHTALAAHIRACPVCLGRAQKLHRTIRAIVERADSKIETIYHTAEDAEDAPTEEQNTCQYPVSVEVMHGGSDAACDSNRSQRTSPGPLRGLRGPSASLAQAAVIGIVIVALASFVRMTIPTASGTNVGHIRKAVEKAPSIRVVRTNRQAELIQELLIARHSDRLVNRTTQECTVYDLGHDFKRTIGPQTGTGGAPAKLSKFEREQARQLMASCLLDVLERISPDTRLHPPEDVVGRDAHKGLDVYELQRSQPAGNSLVRNRCLVYIDAKTGLPQRTESYQQGPSNPGWRLVTTTTYTYPTEQEMDASIRSLFPAN